MGTRRTVEPWIITEGGYDEWRQASPRSTQAAGAKGEPRPDLPLGDQPVVLRCGPP